MPRAPLDAISKIESFIISIPRGTPYLGPLKDGEFINEKGYLIRKGNRSIYPSSDLSVVVKVTAESGKVGWGETYGIAAPEAVKTMRRAPMPMARWMIPVTHMPIRATIPSPSLP